MYWEQDGLKMAEDAMKAAEIAAAAAENKNALETEGENDDDQKPKEEELKKLNLESPRRTLLPYEDYEEGEENYNVPACWREVPINADAWITKFKKIEEEHQSGKDGKSKKEKDPEKYTIRYSWHTKNYNPNPKTRFLTETS